MFAEMVFSRCFDKVNSDAQNIVAIKISSSPVVKVNAVNFSRKKFPISNRIADKITILLSFSFRKVSARIAAKINMVLCIKDEDAPDVSCKPLKNSRNGIEPPKRPTKESCSHCFGFSFTIFLYCVVNKIIDSRKIATKVFFANVKM